MRISVFSILAVLFLSAMTYGQETFTAPVTHIQDGDTLTVTKSGGEEIRVRFGGIDTPELSQRHGQAARDALVALVEGKTVRVELTGKRSGSRMIGEVFVPASAASEEVDVSLELVRGGHAWWFWQFADEAPERAQVLAAAEVEAKLGRRGLFAADDPIYPRVFRRGGRTPNEVMGDVPDVVDREVRIVSLVPNPDGADADAEKVTIRNGTSLTVSLAGWPVRDDDGGRFTLSGNLAAGSERTFMLDSDSIMLGNGGDTVFLHDADGNRVQTVEYEDTDDGQVISVAGP